MMTSFPKSLRRVAFGLTLLLVVFARSAAAPLKIAYSDWPGWVAWDIAIEKGWLKSAGVDAEFVWSDYAASIKSFADGKVDGVLIANVDALSVGANGAKNVMILLTDYSNGNDLIIASPQVKTLADLKGKKSVSRSVSSNTCCSLMRSSLPA